MFCVQILEENQFSRAANASFKPNAINSAAGT